MMLETEFDAFAELERATLPIQPPDDAAVASIDLVHAACVSGRDHVIAIAVFVDTIDVKVVPRI